MPRLDLVKLGYPVRFFLYTSCPVLSGMYDQTGINLTLSLDVDLRISTYQPDPVQQRQELTKSIQLISCRIWSLHPLVVAIESVREHTVHRRDDSLNHTPKNTVPKFLIHLHRPVIITSNKQIREPSIYTILLPLLLLF